MAFTVAPSAPGSVLVPWSPAVLGSFRREAGATPLSSIPRSPKGRQGDTRSVWSPEAEGQGHRFQLNGLAKVPLLRLSRAGEASSGGEGPAPRDRSCRRRQEHRPLTVPGVLGRKGRERWTVLRLGSPRSSAAEAGKRAPGFPRPPCRRVAGCGVRGSHGSAVTAGLPAGLAGFPASGRQP